jgi:hypothetical protein
MAEFRSPQALAAHKEYQKALFTEHMYKCSGRTNGIYTNLWKEFCMNEAGPTCRDMFFERQEAIKRFIDAEESKLPILLSVTQSKTEEFIPEFHD